MPKQGHNLLIENRGLHAEIFLMIMHACSATEYSGSRERPDTDHISRQWHLYTA